MRPLIYLFLLMLVATFTQIVSAQTPYQSVQQRPAQKQEILWKKLEANVLKVDQELDAVVGVAILDLTDGRMLLHNADEVFPTASSIKIAVLAELYHQEEQSAKGIPGKAKLTDLYTMDVKDLVEGSDIMAGLTPGATRVTNRDLATFMVAVSDNTATNVLINRLGMDNINALVESLGVKEMHLRRKMMDLNAASEGRENVSTPREMVALLEAIYRDRAFNKNLADNFFKLLATHKESDIPRYLPDGVVVANKPGSLEAVRNDSGIVFVKNRPFVISVMTTYAQDEPAAELAISQVALEAFRYFDRLSRASIYGRVISTK